MLKTIAGALGKTLLSVAAASAVIVIAAAVQEVSKTRMDKAAADR